MARKCYENNAKPYLEKIRMWRSRNTELKEIAKRLGVAASTLRKWGHEHKELAEALEYGFDEAQAFAENVIFERMNSKDERISLKAAEFFLTHRCGYMTESQRKNTEINRQRMENAKQNGENQTQVIERVLGGAPSE